MPIEIEEEERATTYQAIKESLHRKPTVCKHELAPGSFQCKKDGGAVYPQDIYSC
jgi:hypothetical protein